MIIVMIDRNLSIFFNMLYAAGKIAGKSMQEEKLRFGQMTIIYHKSIQVILPFASWQYVNRVIQQLMKTEQLN